MDGSDEPGVLGLFDAVLVGRAITRSHEREPPAKERERYRERQRAAVAEAFAGYNTDASVVLALEFGHTHPTVSLPVGPRVCVDHGAERVTVERY